MTPGSCTTGIHILLEECGPVFEVYLVNLMAGDQHSADYRRLNPKGTIPTLVLEDGTALTDFLSISLWLAQAYPQKSLLSDDLITRLKTIEVLNYVVNTIHGQGFTRIFTAEKYSEIPAEQERVQAQGRTLVSEYFMLADEWLEGGGYLFGQFSIADAALFYTEFWAKHIGLPLPSRCQEHYRLMLTRASVDQVMTEEGYGKMLSEIRR
tara:strand:- start:23951 stop:24577 length:627 start_codon:yes stop_codon:yes gene_type:complete